MPFSLRLDSETEARIRRLAAKAGRSRSDVVREAVARFAADDPPAPAASAWDRVRPYAGVIRSGGPGGSSGTHARYRALVRDKHRERRAR